MVYLKDEGYQVLGFNKETKLYTIKSRYNGLIAKVPRERLIADNGDKEIVNALKNN